MPPIRQTASLASPAVLGVLLLLSPAQADDADNMPLSILGRVLFMCPVCRQEFTTLACTQSNTRGGIDRDLFARAVGPQPEFYRVSTCPGCGYSGYAADFEPDLPLPPDFRDKILKRPRLKLPEFFKPTSDPRELDASIRYSLAIQCYEWRQRSDEALAWLHLRSSWILREEGSSLPPDERLARVLTYVERWRPPLESNGNQLDVEMRLATRISEALFTGQFNRFQRPYVELALALILRRHGENAQAAALLDRLLPLKEFSPTLREAMERMRVSIGKERESQVRAVDLFERALLSDQIVGPNRGPALYIVGELYRRLGHDAQAITWFDRAVASRSLPTDLIRWADEQRGACVR